MHNCGNITISGVLENVSLLLLPICFLLVLLYTLPGKEKSDINFGKPLVLEVKSAYSFSPSDGISYKEYRNIGVTYYAKGEPTVPGITMRSGRHVYEGAIAVSRDMWGKLCNPGDLVYIKRTNRWYKVEDTMGEQYKMRIDIYTHDMKVANSGSTESDIVIVRQPQ